ncbi:hypothetical protein V8F33_013892, partial [Rhypophila sp. PSN 637]
MTAIEEKYKHLCLANEIKPLLHRYSIEYDSKAKKEALLQLLLANGVPLDRVQLNTIAPNLKKIAPLGLAQIVLDYPPSGPAPGGGEGSGSSVPGTESDPPPPPSGTESDPSPPPSGTESDPSPPPPGTESDPSPPPPRTESDPPPPPPGTDKEGREGSGSATTRSIQRLVNLPNHQGHADMAKSLGLTDIKNKVTDLVHWFGSVAKSQNIPVGSALVFFNSYLSSPDLDFVAYLLNNDNSREGWYERTSNPDAKKQAAKRLDNLWSLALDSSGVVQPSTTAATTSDPIIYQDFFMDVIDPFDNMPTKGKVIGIHMTKKSTLGVRLPSLSIEYPDLGRGLWVDCKSEKDVEAYKKFVEAFLGTGKLSSAPETLLAGCETPVDFKLDCVFRM